MPILEDAKRMVERLTGLARPARRDLSKLTRARKAHLFCFSDDGKTPNNPKLPLVLYRTPVTLVAGLDPAAILEDLFAKNGWRGSWRDGVYDFLHFHTRTHEVLGIARGTVRVKFGGVDGKSIELKAGDVVVLPAGTGHRSLRSSRDLLVVGAYPASGKYDEPKPSEVKHEEAVAAIARVGLPRADPVYGSDGPLIRHWSVAGARADARHERRSRLCRARR
jgi:uncharacterized protein YjlB